MIAGTLAYMAPEQTGRMNRSIDSGVALYEMLTGELPFTASDPHCAAPGGAPNWPRKTLW